MKEQVKAYIKLCPTCQVSKTSNQNIKEPIVITTSYPFEIYLWTFLVHFLAEIKIIHIS